MTATSLARNPSASRRMRTARWRGGRSGSALTKASEIASLASWLAGLDEAALTAGG